jgi:hypothetical protein
MRKVLALFLVLGLVLAACGGDDNGDGGDSGDAVADAENCAAIADLATDQIQELLTDVEELSLDELAGDETPEALGTFETQMNEIQERATELNCSDEELSALMEERVGDLEANGLVAEALLEQLQTEGFFNTQ